MTTLTVTDNPPVKPVATSPSAEGRADGHDAQRQCHDVMLPQYQIVHKGGENVEEKGEAVYLLIASVQLVTAVFQLLTEIERPRKPRRHKKKRKRR